MNRARVTIIARKVGAFIAYWVFWIVLSYLWFYHRTPP